MSSYKLGSIPGSKSYVEELADYWEILALCATTASVSKAELIRTLAKELDEELVSGIESDDDKLIGRIEDAWVEIARRVKACAGGYPFSARQKSAGNHPLLDAATGHLHFHVVGYQTEHDDGSKIWRHRRGRSF